MVNRYIVNKPIWSQLRKFIRQAYNQCDKSVEEAALLQRQVRELFSNLMKTGLESYGKIDRFFHNVETDSIGNFVVTICYNQETKESILYIKSWNWRINPYVYPNLYSQLLQIRPIYDIVSTDNCGFSIVKDARGYYNYINSQKQLISKEWFQKVISFQNRNGYVFAYVRKLNGDIYQIDETGMLHKIDDNHTKWNAEALLGEARITHIIIEVINSYLRENLLLTKLNE